MRSSRSNRTNRANRASGTTKSVLGAWAIAACLVVVGLGCDSTPKPTGPGSAGPKAGADGGGPSGGAPGTGASGGTAGGGAAGSHGANDGGAAGTGAAGKSGGAAGKGGGACICTDIYAPVCGADGQTYASDCTAGCAGVAVAHDGVCTSAPPATDAGADGGSLGRCDRDSDCVYRTKSCSCTGMCAAASDPVPAPPKAICDIVCPAIAFACSCVKHLCTNAAAAL